MDNTAKVIENAGSFRRTVRRCYAAMLLSFMPRALASCAHLENSPAPRKKIGDIRLKGGKTGILMIHGYSSSTLALKSTAEALNKKGYTVYCILLPGHGRTLDDLEKVTKKDYYNFVDDKFDEFSKKVDKVFVLGHSLGGLLTLRLAANRDIDGIIVTSVPMMDPENGMTAELIRRSVKVMGKIAARLPRLSPTYAINTDFLDMYGTYSTLSVVAMGPVLDIVNDVGRTLGKIEEPILAVQSSHDILIDNRSAKFLIQNVGSKTGKAVYVNSISHRFFLIEALRKQLVQEVHEFIQNVEKRNQEGPGGK